MTIFPRITINDNKQRGFNSQHGIGSKSGGGEDEENVPLDSLKRLKMSSIAARLTWFLEPALERVRRFKPRLIDAREAALERELEGFGVRVFLTRPLDAPPIPDSVTGRRCVEGRRVVRRGRGVQRRTDRP